MKHVIFETHEATDTHYISCSTCQNGMMITAAQYEAFINAKMYSHIVLCNSCKASIEQALTQQGEQPIVAKLQILLAQSEELMQQKATSPLEQIQRAVLYQRWASDLFAVSAEISGLVVDVAKAFETNT